MSALFRSIVQRRKNALKRPLSCVQEEEEIAQVKRLCSSSSYSSFPSLSSSFPSLWDDQYNFKPYLELDGRARFSHFVDRVVEAESDFNLNPPIYLPPMKPTAAEMPPFGDYSPVLIDALSTDPRELDMYLVKEEQAWNGHDASTCHSNSPSDISLSSTAVEGEERQPKKERKSKFKAEGKQMNGKRRIWSFMADLLMQPQHRRIIAWTGNGLEFRINNIKAFELRWSHYNGRVHVTRIETVVRSICSSGDRTYLQQVNKSDKTLWRFEEEFATALHMSLGDVLNYVQQNAVDDPLSLGAATSTLSDEENRILNRVMEAAMKRSVIKRTHGEMMLLKATVGKDKDTVDTPPQFDHFALGLPSVPLVPDFRSLGRFIPNK